MANQTSDALDESQGPSVPKASRWVTSRKSLKSMEDALKAAERIRLQLADRVHSDSTELVAEDRQR